MALNPPFSNPTGPAPFNQFNDEIKSSISLSNELNKILGQLVSKTKEIGNPKNYEGFGKILAEYKEGKSKLDDINDVLSQQNQLLSSQGSIEADLTKKIDEGVKARRKLTELSNDLKDAQIELNSKITAGNVNAADYNRVISLKSQVDILNQQSQAYEGILLGQDASLNTLDQSIQNEIKKYIILKNQGEQAEDYVDNRKKEAGLLKLLLSDEQIIAAIKAHQAKLAKEEANKQKEKLSNILKESFAYQSIKATVKVVTDLLQIEKFTLSNILKSAFELNKVYTDSAKQLGMSSRVTREIADNFASTAPKAGSLASFGSSLVQTRKNELEALGQINQELGTANFYSQERLNDQVSLTKLMGVDAKTAAQIQTLSLVSGKTSKEILDSVNNRVISLGKENNIFLDNKKVLADVAKVSGQLAIQYKNNPELLAKAVVQVQKLGLNFEQAAGMANKLLDFQSSIENELEAELLTGKALNLEQARYLSLTGDSAGAAEELMNQIGGINEFQNLNVLQQRSLANAIGLGVDELSNSLRMQEALTKSGFESEEALNAARQKAIEQGKSREFIDKLRRAGNSEELIQSQMQLANQEKMTLLVDKMLETITNLAEPLTNIANIFESIANFAGGITNISKVLASLWVGRIAFGATGTLQSILMANKGLGIQKGLQASLSAIFTKNAVKAGATAAFASGPAWPLAIGAIGAILAGIGISGAFSGGSSFNVEDKTIKGISPSTAPPSSFSNQNQQNSNTEITVNFGGNTYAKINTQNNKSQTSYA